MFDIEIKQIESAAEPNNGTFLQTPFWCEFKARHGWTYRRFLINAKLPAEYAENDEHECHTNEQNTENRCRVFLKQCPLRLVRHLLHCYHLNYDTNILR